MLLVWEIMSQKAKFNKLAFWMLWAGENDALTNEKSQIVYRKLLELKNDISKSDTQQDIFLTDVGMVKGCLKKRKSTSSVSGWYFKLKKYVSKSGNQNAWFLKCVGMKRGSLKHEKISKLWI